MMESVCEFCFIDEKGLPDCSSYWCDNYNFAITPALDALMYRIAKRYIPAEKAERVPELPAPPVILPVPPHESVYELTLTTNVDDVYALKEAFQKISNSNMFEVAMSYACVELTKEGLPHIHAVLYSNKKYLDATKVKQFWKLRYELKRVRKIDNYLNYIKKEDGNPIIVDYCARKGIDQFWYGIQKV